MKVWKKWKVWKSDLQMVARMVRPCSEKKWKNQVWLDAMDLVDLVDLVGVTSCCKYHGCSALLTNEEHGKSVFFQVLPAVVHSCEVMSRFIKTYWKQPRRNCAMSRRYQCDCFYSPCMSMLLLSANSTYLIIFSKGNNIKQRVYIKRCFEENYPWNRSPWKSCLFELMYRTQWMWISFLESFDEGERLRCLLAPGSNQSLGAFTHLFSTMSKRIPTHLAETAAKWNTNILTHWKNTSKLNLPAVSSLHEWSESNLDCIQVKAT